MQWIDDLNYGLAAFGIRLPTDAAAYSLDSWAATLAQKPATRAAQIVAASGAIFYALERDHNPRVNELADAFVYCSTCLSVGYANIFAVTPGGKLLGSFLMTVGPALAAKTLDGPSGDRAGTTQSEVLATLQAILKTLEKT